MSERVPDFTVELDGVDVGFRDMTSGQITMANLIVDRARKEARKVGDTQAVINMMAQFFNLIESLIITDEDRAHVFDAMLTGKIDTDAAYLILRRGVPAPPDDDEDVVEVAKRPVKSTTAARNRVRK